jgi:hypothetical protein
LNFKASAAETGIGASLKVVFLESTIYKLSVDASFVHNLAVRGDKKQFFPAV